MSMTEPYKGVRDFYPEDWRVQQYLFGAMRRAVERFGYEEMNASILELTDLYLKKTSEEVVNEEAYTFEDRGGRSVTLRPEMTPTVARMVAAKKRELGFPLRWYSIQNLFRYQKPQKGRLREHWQLNADLFGVSGIEADIEIISLANAVLRELGASDGDFEIRVSDRRTLERVYRELGIPEEVHRPVTRLLDKKEKGDILPALTAITQSQETAEALLKRVSSPESFTELSEMVSVLHARGIVSAIADPSITRGFDYYTGMVFEVFDTNRENKRSIFGGGRYDNLVEQYGSDSVPAVGFGMGDVTTRDFLETHNLLPDIASSTYLYIAPATDNDDVSSIANALRERGVHVAVGMKHKKIPDHIRAAEKLHIPFFAAWGENESTSGILTVKNLDTGEEFSGTFTEVAATLTARYS